MRRSLIGPRDILQFDIARAPGAPDGKDRPSRELASSAFCYGRRVVPHAQRAALEVRPPRPAQVATHGGAILDRPAGVRRRHPRVDVAAPLARASGREAWRLPAGGCARRAPRPRGDARATSVVPPGPRGRFRVGPNRGAPPAPRGASSRRRRRRRRRGGCPLGRPPVDPGVSRAPAVARRGHARDGGDSLRARRVLRRVPCGCVRRADLGRLASAQLAPERNARGSAQD